MPQPSGLQSVVVATDFSAGAQLAVERAVALPLAPKAKITLLHVLHEDIPGRLRKQAREEAERSLEKSLARLRTGAFGQGKRALSLVGDVVEGSAAHEIVKRAHTVEADLICIGRHGRVPVVDLFVGTTAQKVARESDVPVLLVQLGAKEPYRRCVAALALDRQSAEVVKAATRLLEPGAPPLTLLHCVAVPFEDFVNLSPASLAEFQAQYHQDATTRLEALVKKVGVDGARIEVQTGDARALILGEVGARDAQLVAVGKHTRKAVQRFFTGSVAEWVLTHSDCDVLLVPR